MSALVIKAWRAETKAIDDQNNFVSITGRESGLIAWILSLMRVDPTTTILVGLDRVEFSSASLAGTESRMIPLQGVCSTYYGYYKPWKSAVSIAVFSAFIGLSMAVSAAERGAIGGALTAFITAFSVGSFFALIYYFLNRTLTLGFIENSGVVSGIRFKRSVIENVDINQERAKAVCILIQRLIEAKEKRMSQSARQSA